MMQSVVAGLSRLACGPSVAWHCDPESRRQRIYFANHASHLDFVVLWASLPAAQRRSVRPVAGRDYWEHTAVRRYLAREIFRAVLVERSAGSKDPAYVERSAGSEDPAYVGRSAGSEDPAYVERSAGSEDPAYVRDPVYVREVAARAAVEAMAREMGSDTSLIVFPEGTRSVDCELRAFKSGLYHLARAKPAAELIPVYLHNLNRILPRGEYLPVPMLSRVTFGAPLPVEPHEPKDQFLERARAALLTLRDQ